MTPEVWTSLIAAGASLVVGVVTGYFVPVLKTRREHRLNVEDVHAHFRDALLRAAFDLQSRLYNIINGFLRTYYGRSERDRRYAEESTLWLVAQYFGWVEAMRQEAQFLDVGSVRSARNLELALGRVQVAFASDRRIRDPLFLIFRADQRAMGELMMADEGGDGARCIGYTEFQRRLGEPDFESRFSQLKNDIAQLAVTRERPVRLVHVQRALMELVDLLDPKCRRFPDLEHRGMVPLEDSRREAPAASLARGV